MRNTHIRMQIESCELAWMLENQSSVIETRFLHTAHQFGRGYTIRLGESENGSKRRALHTPFERAQNRSVYAELDENIQLRKPCCFPNFTQHTTQSSFRA